MSMKSRIARLAVCVTALALTGVAGTLPASAGLSQSGPAPQFQLDSRAGKPVNLSQYKGQVVMINFWATWCGPCRQEMPLLESIYKKYNKMGFTMIGVNVEPDSNAA